MSYSNIGESGGRSVLPFTRGDIDETSSAISFASSRRAPASALSEPLCVNGDQSEDPYYVFREELNQKMIQVDEGLADFLRIVHQRDTAVNTQELKEAKKNLKRHIKSAESTLKDIQTTVQLIKSNPEKFGHISEAELHDRDAFVHSNNEKLHMSKGEMQSDSVKVKMLADERAKALRRAGAGALGAKTDAERQNTNLIADSQARTSLLIQHQDDTLDELGEAVVRVGDMAGNVHEELGQQNKMLTEMEEDLDRVEEELGLVMGKLAVFLQTKNKWQLRAILIMSVTVVVLFFLVLYT